MTAATPLPLSERNCSWARSLDIFGDKWSMMIIREAFGGASKYTEFQRNTGVARNILTSRLESLCDHGIFQRVPQREGSSRVRYVLTSKGQGLFPIIVALGQWGDKWIFGTQGEPVQIVDKTSSAPVQQVAVFSRDGQQVSPQDVTVTPGPGASDTTRAYLEKRG
ncbi:putative HTH-type transcriptional regulator [Ruegeria sp. THAF57]|uniref:winged helix-turn-helix transcriptional regulator n=1 Tax=Ruegeria sp. THAF57 TaxID=2744555 RepID=UPI0015DDEA26|nr:helix-turn-helix domain-containing protein [Ruegeria sp. THAF57]CAD0187193.1 putative HTH-type transcriptional regulator [Ruegeria sp. THAF57]